MTNKRIPNYNDKADYNTNSPSYYHELARKQGLIKELALKIWAYDKTLNESLENIENVLNEYITIVDGKLEVIDNIIGEGFNDRIEELLREWVNDGTLEHIINVEIFNKKADKADLTWVSYDMFKDPYDENALSDEEVIRLTHEYANEHGLDVINKNGEYYLGKGTGIPIKTNVDWGNTVFHIDESAGSGKHFIVEPSKPAFEPSFTSAEKQLIIEGLKKGNNSIPALADYKNYFMIFHDSNKIVAQRFLAGSPSTNWTMEEYIYIGEGGIIEGGIYNDFTDITSIEAKYAENNYLTIEGGTFILNGVGNPEISDAYNSGGIGINRSRVIINNQFVGVEEDRLTETDTASAGFYNYSKAYDITFKNIRSLPRKRNTITNRGTYGFEGSRVINLTFDNVKGNADNSYWGVQGNNKIKNMVVKNSVLNRVDVHFDAKKLSVFDSEIGQIALHGGDTLTVRNLISDNNTPITFRGDYGGSWDGDITVDGLKIKPTGATRIMLFSRTDFAFPQTLYTGKSIYINDVTFDFRGQDILNNIDTVLIDGFSNQSYIGSYLFNELIVKNVKVINNENEKAGCNLFRLSSPFNAKLEKKGSYQTLEAYTHIEPNMHLFFENIDVNSDISTPQSNHYPSIFFGTYGQSTLDQYDEYSPYPHITIRNCRNLKLQLKASPNHVIVENSEIVQLDAQEGGLSNSVLNVINTEMNPKLNGETDEDAFYLPTHSTFTNCSLNPIVVNGVVDIDRSIDKNGLVTFELDKSRLFTIAHKLDISVSSLIRNRMTELMNKDNTSFADGLIMACSRIAQHRKYAYLTSGREADLPDMQNFHYNYGSNFYTTDTGSLYVFTLSGWKKLQMIA